MSFCCVIRGKNMWRKLKYKIVIMIMLVLCMTENVRLIMAKNKTETAEENTKTDEQKENDMIVESYIMDNRLTVILNVDEKMKDATALMDGRECPVQEIYKVSDKSVSTLILIDNSSSISKTRREDIREVIESMIEQKKENEEISIATIGKQINYLVDFTTDRYDLLKGFEKLKYTKQTTHLTSELSTAMGELEKLDKDSTKRIIIFSDGYNNGTEGKTSNELLGQLEEITYPVFTIGCVTKKNKKDLNENLHMFSRTTIGITGINVDDKTGSKKIMDYLNKINNYVGITVDLDKELLDGTKKAFQITANLENGEQITIMKSGIQMPMVKKGVEEREKVSKIEEKIVSKDNSKIIQIVIVCIVGIMAIVCIVAGTIFLLKKRKKRKSFEEKVQDMDVMIHRGKRATDERMEIERNASRNFISMEEDIDRTVLVTSGMQEMGNRLTGSNYPIWNIKVRDISNNRIFEKQVEKELIIGRAWKEDAEQTIVINYDTSISKAHCRLFFQDGGCYLEDLHSANHTKVNGSLVEEVISVISGDVITLGNISLELVVETLD